MKEACFDRCISTDGRPAAILRRDLGQWLDLALAPTDISTSSNDSVSSGSGGGRLVRVTKVVNNPMIINEHNRRFALLG